MIRVKRSGFRGGSMRRSMRGGFRGIHRRPYRRFWGRPYRPFMGRRPFWWYPIWWRPLYWMPWTMMMGGFLYLLYDSMAYKLYNDDGGRIERETGKRVRDLNEDELKASMKRLGISKLELSPEDRETISKSEKSVRDLNKIDLLEAMKRLGIKKLELSPKDEAALSQSISGEDRYCIYCGNRLSSKAMYCDGCGRKRALK